MAQQTSESEAVEAPQNVLDEFSCSSNSSVESTPLQTDMEPALNPDIEELQSDDSNMSSETEEMVIPDLELLTPSDEQTFSPTLRAQPIDDPQAQQRREKNRVAASDCRKRQKKKTDQLEQMVDVLEAEGTRQKEKIKKLQRLTTAMASVFNQHLVRCKRLQHTRPVPVSADPKTQRPAVLERQTSGPFIQAL